MVNIWNEGLDEMEENYRSSRSSSMGEWIQSDSKASSHELEEGEIDEEDEEVYFLAEFDGRKKINVNNVKVERVVKQDIDERIPFIINCSLNERQVIIPNMSHAAPPLLPTPKTPENRSKSGQQQQQQQRVYDRDERRQNQRQFVKPNLPKAYRFGNRSIPKFNNRNQPNRPHMSGYSLRRQSILRSIHRRSRAAAACDCKYYF